MPEYRVEELVGDEVVLSRDVVAPTPRSAAAAATGREVKFRKAQQEWIRVVEIARGLSFGFAYVGTDRRFIIDRQILEAAKQLREQRVPKPLRKKDA